MNPKTDTAGYMMRVAETRDEPIDEPMNDT